MNERKRLKKAFIIVLAALAVFFTILLISSIGGKSVLDRTKYLIDNGREVDGDIVDFKKDYVPRATGGYWNHYVYRLYYEYEEDGTVWKTTQEWEVRSDKVEEQKEREEWCKDKVGKSIKLIIADNGACEVSGTEQALYKEEYNFVYVRGGLLAAADVVCIAVMLFLMFYAPKKPKEISNIPV